MNIEIYTKPGCAFCTRIKNFLNGKSIAFTEKRLDVDFTREFLVETYPAAKMYPVVIVDGYFIGGSEELQTMIQLDEQQTTQLLNEEH